MVCRSTAKAELGQEVAGRYLLLSVPQLLMGWWVYVSGTTVGNDVVGGRNTLQLLDVRVWLACAEMRERRVFLDEGRTARYRLSELQRLVGGGLSRLRASVKRLRAAGLIHWDGSTLELARSPEELKVSDLSGFWETMEFVETKARLVPLPRRVVRFMAGGATKVEIATILAHLIRCCFRKRGGGVTSTGNCLASWVADVFDVNATSVKEARARLTRLGLLKEVEQEQWHRNRFGARVSVNLLWEDASDAATSAQKPSNERTEERPPVALIHNQTPTAIETVSLLTEGSKHQPSGETPEAPTGVFENEKGKPEASNSGKSPTPTLKHILPEDLKSSERLNILHKEAVDRGLAPSGERGVLEFLSLAAHAFRYGTKNPPGLFARLLRDQKWHFITQDDEEFARRKLIERRRSEEQPLLGGQKLLLSAAVETKPVEAKAASQDQKLVWELRRAFGARGIRSDEAILRELQKARPEWTWERWMRATLGVVSASQGPHEVLPIATGRAENLVVSE